MGSEGYQGAESLELVSRLSSGEVSSHLVVVPDTVPSASRADALAESLGIELSCHIVQTPLPSVDRVEEFAEQLRCTLKERGVRWCTLFGLGRGGSVAQALAINGERAVRRLVLLDATTRLAPGAGQRLLDAVERVLPLGLPLRSASNAYDSRPLLHRIHCPTLVLSSRRAGAFLNDQAELMTERIPNSWRHRLDGEPFSETGAMSDGLRGLLEAFAEVPAKRPQKNLTG